MRIIDGNGEEKDALSLRVITHEVVDAISGGAVPTRYVEAVIQGRNRPDTWTEWYLLLEFQVNNPGIEL